LSYQQFIAISLCDEPAERPACDLHWTKWIRDDSESWNQLVGKL
jgi:hypothetical protein